MDQWFVTSLQCTRCGAHHDPADARGSCDCGGPLFVRYDLEAIGRKVNPKDLAMRPSSMWRYAEVLPVRAPDRAVTMGEGCTPLIPLERTARDLGVSKLWLKDEGLNPTGTFKARGASAGVSRLRELGVSTVVMTSSGNAGGAWAAYCARAGIRFFLTLPRDALDPMKKESVVTGARVYTFSGPRTEGGNVAARTASAHGWFNACTLREPYRVEGKKTIGYEIAEQLGWRFPDWIVFPTGGGVGVIGIWKAVAELSQLGWVDAKKPKMVCAQYDGCAPLVKAFREGRDDCEPWTNPLTPPGGLTVPKPVGDFLVLKALRESNGTGVAVSEGAAVRAVRELAETEGIFACFPTGVALAGVKRMVQEGVIREQDEVVVVSTGMGLKYASLLEAEVPVLPEGAVIPPT